VTDRPPALALTGITKRFGRVTALEGADLVVGAGTVHALLGENGAGKTTLMRVAFGLLEPDAGQILVHGEPTQMTSPSRAISCGIGMVHQHFTNVGSMTVAENTALGGRGLLRHREITARVTAIGQETGLVLDPDARAENLPVGAQQRLEIVKALAREARILILDEPTAVLAPSEADALLSWLRDFAASGGTVVLITHKLPEALSIAESVTVLRRGRTVMTSLAAATNARALALAMVGEDVRESTSSLAAAVGPPVVRADRLTLHNEQRVPVVSDATFEVRGSEIVGIAAVEGSGQRDLLRALAGRARTTTGTLTRPLTVGFIPEDRHRDALVLDFTATENVALRDAHVRHGRMKWKSARGRAEALIEAFEVRGTPATRARDLSGGNQQKLVLARELDGGPELLVAENPTRGLDVRAAAAVHGHIRAAAHRGAAVVIHSTDLDELLSLATRVLVLHGGRLREIPIDRDLVGRAMLGVE
jgi:simple sugar transport system ATP-binding protein